MARDLYEKRKLELKKYVIQNHNLPKVWEVRFFDNEDMRLWFDKISKAEVFKDYIEEIDDLLKQFNLKILNDNEKEQEFLNYIIDHNQIPFYGEAYFSDNDEMHSWYMSYKQKNRSYETTIHNNLKEYQELDLANIWFFIKEEFVAIINKLKRIPNHGEVIIRDGIDVRVVYDKLETFDPEFIENLLLHLQTYNKNGLSIGDRTLELLSCISTLGYIPFLQEARFSDGIDMFTWYSLYRQKLPNLDEEIDKRIVEETKIKNVNIYFISNFRKSGGKFYTICTNVGERLDLSNISTFEEVKELDDTIVKRGGLILKRDEKIESVNFLEGNIKKRN